MKVCCFGCTYCLCFCGRCISTQRIGCIWVLYRRWLAQSFVLCTEYDLLAHSFMSPWMGVLRWEFEFFGTYLLLQSFSFFLCFVRAHADVGNGGIFLFISTLLATDASSDPFECGSVMHAIIWCKQKEGSTHCWKLLLNFCGVCPSTMLIFSESVFHQVDGESGWLAFCGLGYCLAGYSGTALAWMGIGKFSKRFFHYNPCFGGVVWW